LCIEDEARKIYQLLQRRIKPILTSGLEICRLFFLNPVIIYFIPKASSFSPQFFSSRKYFEKNSLRKLPFGLASQGYSVLVLLILRWRGENGWFLMVDVGLFDGL